MSHLKSTPLEYRSQILISRILSSLCWLVGILIFWTLKMTINSSELMDLPYTFCKIIHLMTNKWKAMELWLVWSKSNFTYLWLQLDECSTIGFIFVFLSIVSECIHYCRLTCTITRPLILSKRFSIANVSLPKFAKSTLRNLILVPSLQVRRLSKDFLFYDCEFCLVGSSRDIEFILTYYLRLVWLQNKKLK